MRGILAVKLRRDLQARWPRLLMMVVAIALSLTVFGGVLLAWSAIGRETRNAYGGTHPASATVVFDQDIDADRMAAIAAQAQALPGVLQAIGRSQFTTEVKVNGQVRDTPLQVYVVAADDPMRMATFEMQRSSWPPAPHEILVRQDALGLLDVAVGDTVTITTPHDERQLQLRVADTVYDPSLAPSPQQQTGAAYLSTAALTAAGKTARLDQLKLQFADASGAPSRDRHAIVTSATEVGRWLQQRHNITVREIQVPEPFTHPHQSQADALLLSLLAGGAAALLLSTILVANMLNGLFMQQIPQIGIMKAVGARSGRIAMYYLTIVVVVAAAATMLALVPALLLARGGVLALTGFLGIEPVRLVSPWWTYLVILGVGLGLPPLMALLPLLRVSRTTVRAAIDYHGTNAASGTAARILARVGRIRGLNPGLLLALRNTVRRPARFVLSVGLLATAGMVFVAGMSLNSSTSAVDEERKEQRTWDVEVQLAAPADVQNVTTLVRQVASVTGVEGYRRAQAGIGGADGVPVTNTYPDQGHGSLAVIAVAAGDTMLRVPKLLEGRWLTPGETGTVVLNQITRANAVPDVRTGDDVQLIVDGKQTTWKVVGLVEEREGGAGGTYVTAEGLASALGQPQKVNQLRIATTVHEEKARTAIADAVDQSLTQAGIKVDESSSVSRSDAVSAGHLGPVLLILLGLAVPLPVIGAIGLASTMSSNVLDRTREFGIMHAIGARPKAVRRIVVAEGLFLALTSCVVAALPALGLIALLGEGLGNLFMKAPLPFRVSALAVGVWVVMVVLIAIVATDAAATGASRMTVREALSRL